MSNERLSKERRNVRLRAIITIVGGLVFLACALGLDRQAERGQSFTSLRVLTKARPVVGEWVSVPDADEVQVIISRTAERTAQVFSLGGLFFVLLGLGAMGQAELLTRVERLEAEIARLTKERSGPDATSPPVEPGKQ
jgi:hypothetical protein